MYYKLLFVRIVEKSQGQAINVEDFTAFVDFTFEQEQGTGAALFAWTEANGLS